MTRPKPPPLTPALPPVLESHHPTAVPHSILELMEAHLPYTLPVLRRIQFAKNFADRGGGGATTTTGESRVLWVYQPEYPHPTIDDQHRFFAAAYVDLTKWPETQVWVFSSVEYKVSFGGGRVEVGGMEMGREEWEGEGWVHDGLLGRLFEGIAEMGKKEQEGARGGDEEEGVGVDMGKGRRILVGSIHEFVRRRMLALGMGLEKTSLAGEQEWEWNYKILFRVEELPELPVEMREERWEVEGRELYWDKVRKEDVKLVKSRTGIDRQEVTLLMVPSLAVRLGATSEAVGWAFLGLDGTVMSLHVEEPYRRLGLGKAIATKLMRENVSEFGTDGIGAADVWIENEKSQGLCYAIGGTPVWIVSWGILDLDSVRNIKL